MSKHREQKLFSSKPTSSFSLGNKCVKFFLYCCISCPQKEFLCQKHIRGRLKMCIAVGLMLTSVIYTNMWLSSFCFASSLGKKLNASLPNIPCMFSSTAPVSVALVEIFLWHWATFVAEKKGDSQTDGHTGCLLGLVCVCCHSNCQAAMAEARRRQRLLRDSWTPRAAEQSKGLAAEPRKEPQRGSIWWICTDSGPTSAAPAVTHNAPAGARFKSPKSVHHKNILTQIKLDLDWGWRWILEFGSSVHLLRFILFRSFQQSHAIFLSRSTRHRWWNFVSK